MSGKSRKPKTSLRSGWTTGACATAAAKGAAEALWGGTFPESVKISLPGGQEPDFKLENCRSGDGWAEAGVIKDAGDDPDVTHGALIVARVESFGRGVSFAAGEGVGTVTRPGLPIAVGEPAINPVPREMMESAVDAVARVYDATADVRITIIVPGGRQLAERTWNPRLGILGGISILGTTGIVRPYSCSAWIASIHRGIDVARASGLDHVAGCTGQTSGQVVQRHYGLPDHAMLDMGDFSGGLLKYLKRHPLPWLTIGGGIAKITKLSQGASDLHSSRSQVDFGALSRRSIKIGLTDVSKANTVLEAVEIAGNDLAQAIADDARSRLIRMLQGRVSRIDVIVVNRTGQIVGHAEER